MATSPIPLFDLSPDDQIFMKGKSNSTIFNRYHNIGQLSTPYIGKNSNFKSSQGDYAPPQATDYYTVQNPLYPYPMMKDWKVDQYIPGWGCAFGKPYMHSTYSSNPDSGFIAPNMFSPKTHFDKSHDPNPKQPQIKLIQNIVMPVGEEIGVGSILPPRENFKFMNNSVPFVYKGGYDGDYVKLIDVNARLQGNMPPYKDGEKWKI